MSTFKPDAVVPHEWIGVDFNRTLAVYHSYDDDMRLAQPIMPMVELVKTLLAAGKKVKIMSAQVWWPRNQISVRTDRTGVTHVKTQPTNGQTFKDLVGYYDRAKHAEAVIRAWCLEHIGQELEVTCERDPGCQMVFDDKARQVVSNTGFIPYLSTEPHPFVYPRLTYQEDVFINANRTHAHPGTGPGFATKSEQPQASGSVATSEAPDAGRAAPPAAL